MLLTNGTIWIRTLSMHLVWTVLKTDWIKLDPQGWVSSWTSPLNPRPCHAGWPQGKATQGKYKVSRCNSNLNLYKLKTTLCQLMSPLVHACNGFAHPADTVHVGPGMDSSVLRASPCLTGWTTGQRADTWTRWKHYASTASNVAHSPRRHKIIYTDIC